MKKLGLRRITISSFMTLKKKSSLLLKSESIAAVQIHPMTLVIQAAVVSHRVVQAAAAAVAAAAVDGK